MDNTSEVDIHTYAGTCLCSCTTQGSTFILILVMDILEQQVTSTEADDAGIGAFEYDPSAGTIVPTGFYALCTKNIKAYGG